MIYFDLRTMLDPVTLESISLIEIYPDVSETKQIPQVLRDAGLPILGDTQLNSTENPVNPLRRMALHCSEIKLNHPTTREMLILQAPLPPSFEILMSTQKPSLTPMEPVSDTELKNANPPGSTSVKVISVSDFLGANRPSSKSSASIHEDNKSQRGNNNDVKRRRRIG